jgi:hypothetical protein
MGDVTKAALESLMSDAELAVLVQRDPGVIQRALRQEALESLIRQELAAPVPSACRIGNLVIETLKATAEGRL